MKGKTKERLNHALLLAHLIPVLLFLFSLTGSAIADKDGIPEDAAMCPACHGSEGLSKSSTAKMTFAQLTAIFRSIVSHQK